MQILLVHGWGFDRKIWQPLMNAMPEYSYETIDLGFIEGTGKGRSHEKHCANINTKTSLNPDIVIGHSLGVLWLLKNYKKAIKGFISINGFDCFYQHVRKTHINAMKKGLNKTSWNVMQKFWAECGAQPYCTQEKLHINRLKEGLEWLGTMDASEEHAKLSCPVLSLASRYDGIVPEAMTKKIWENRPKTRIKWKETQSHLLPLDETDWCAQQIKEFITHDCHQ